MNFKNHPLLKLSEVNHKANQPLDDHSFLSHNSIHRYSYLQILKRRLGYFVYPFKNWMQKKKSLQLLHGISNQLPGKTADRLSIGHKGFAMEIFLAKCRSILGYQPDTVIAYGCGSGEEVMNIAKYLRPKKIIGIDYFNYDKIWSQVKQETESSFKVEVVFLQLDYKNLDAELLGSADIIYSHAVLEHLRDMEVIFSSLKQMLKPGGYFAAQWGPMWYSYSGDHIASELGLEHGFAHLLLSTDEYINFYKTHPRNRADVEAGKLTWLELGLHNFATYDEYISMLEKYFGKIEYLHWVISQEFFKYADRFPNNKEKILQLHSMISGFDLAVPCAGILLRAEK